MQAFLVHVEREGLRDWQILMHDHGADRVRASRYYNSEEVEIDANIESRSPQNMETWYCDDETTATNLAEHFARIMPGRNINVYKLVSVARSASTPPTISKYTEKGLLPA